MIARAFASPPATPLPLRAALWGLWLAGALYAAGHHSMWRDEIRALSFAQRGDGLVGMIVAIRGDGHPALWHIILRSALTLYPDPIVLPVAAFAIGAATAALLAFRAPFRPLMLALALFGAASLYEYVAVARNYGLSVLILFAIAAAWRRYRDRPGAIAALLFLLCNANVHSVVLAGALLLFWWVELLEEKARGGAAWRCFAIAVAFVLVGTASCLWQAYPAADSAARLPASPLGPSAFLLSLFINLGAFFDELMPGTLRVMIPVVIILPLLLVLSIASLRASTGAVLAAAAALVGMTLVFATVHPGYYRHQALFVAFLLAMAWIVKDRQDRCGQGRDAQNGNTKGRATPGRLAFMTLLALQVYASALIFVRIGGGVPESRSRDLAALLARPALRDAIVMGDPDTALEALPYYTRQRLYLAREQRFGTTLTFSQGTKATMTIARLLATARRLQAETGRPIVIVMEERLHSGMAASERMRGYYGALRVDPAEADAFRAATRRIARFAPAVSDESYDVYLLTARNAPTDEASQR